MAIPYGDLKALHQTLYDAGVVKDTLVDWSAKQAAQTGTDLYAEGMNDSWAKQYSHGLNEFLESTGLPNITGRFGEAVGGLVGAPESGRQIGQYIPRMTVESLPMLAGYAAAPFTGGASIPIGLGVSAALTGFGTYGETGSLPAAAISGGAMLAGPAVFGVGAKLGLRAAGAPLIRGAAYETTEPALAAIAAQQGVQPGVQIAERIPINLLQGAAGQIGANVAGAGLFSAAGAAQQLVQGQAPSFSPTDLLLQATLGQGPFAALHLTKGGRAALGGRTSRERAAQLNDSIKVATDAQAAAERMREIEAKAPDEEFPETVDTGLAADVSDNATINDARVAEAGLKEEGTTLGTEQLATVATKDQELAVEQGLQPGNVFGAQMDANTPRREVSGAILSDETGHRFIRVGDDPANGDLAGKVIGWDKKLDPEGLAEGRFSVPEGYHAEYGLRDDGTLDVARALDAVDKLTSVATTGGDLSKATHTLNGIRAKYRLDPVDDVEVSRRIETGEVGDPQSAIRALNNEMRRMVEADDAKVAAPVPAETRAAAGDVAVKQIVEGVASGPKSEATEKILALRREHANRPKFFLDRLVKLADTDPAVAAEVAKYGGLEALRPQVIPGLGDVFMRLDKLPREDTAAGRPIAQVIKESLTKIAGATPNKEDLVKLMDYATMGRSEMLRKHGITKRDLSEWIREPHVAEWAQRLDEQMRGGAGGEGVPYVPIDPAHKAIVDAVSGTGRNALDYLINQADPAYANLARHFTRYLPLLDKTTVRVDTKMGPAIAQHNPLTGDVTINLRQHNLRGGKAEFDNTVMHEMLHALTMRQLFQPWNVGYANQLTKMRLNVMKQMPKPIREVAGRAIESNWLERYNRGEATWKELYPEGAPQKLKDRVYGVLDDHEFITQAFTTDFLNDLAGMRGVGKVNAREGFIKWAGDMLGVDLGGTALSDLWKVTGEVTRINNYVATAQGYAQRYFENQGMSADNARVLAGLSAKVASIGGERKVTAENIVGAVMDTPKFSPEVQAASRSLVDFVNGMLKGDVPEARFAAISEAATKEIGLPTIAPRHMVNYVNEVLLGKRVMGDELMLLDPVVTDYIYAVAREARNVLSAVDGMLDPSVTPYVEGAEKLNRGVIKEVIGRVDKVMEREADYLQAEKEWKQMAAIMPEGYMRAHARDVPPVDVKTEVRAAASETPEQRKLNAFERFIGNGAYISAINRTGGELVSKINQVEPNRKEMLLNSLQAIGLDLTQKHPKFERALLKQYEDPVITKAASKWMYENLNTAIEADGPAIKLDKSSPKIQAILRALPADKQVAAERMVDAGIAMNKVHGQQIVAKQTEIAALNGATLIAPSTGLKAEQNFKVMQEMLQLTNADPMDPMATARKQELIQQLGPETYRKAAEFAVLSNELLKMQTEFVDANPAWVTTQRYGSWDLMYTRGGKTFFDRVNSEKEGRVVAKERGGTVVNLVRNNQNVDIPTTFKVRNLDRVREIERRQFDIMAEVLEPEQLAELKSHSIADQLEAEFMLEGQERGLITKFPKRLARGEEDIDFVKNQLSWMDKSSSFWTRDLLRAQARAWFKDPEIVTRPDVQGRLKKLVEIVLSKDPVIATELRKFAAQWYMGMSPASAMANATQVLTRIASEFTARMGNPIKSYGMVIGAIKDLAAETMKPPAKGSDADWVRGQMKKDDTGAVYYEMDPTAGALEDLQNVMVRKGVQTTAQKFMKMNGQHIDKMLYFFKLAEKMNNFVATRGAFKMYREQGLSREEAYHEAKLLNQFVNDTGGKAARAIGMFAGRDDFSKNAALLSTTLQTYTIGTARQITHWIKTGDGPNPAGIKPGEKYYGNRALVQLLATQFALAGAMGLPGVAGVLAVIEQVFPELEPRKNVQGWINKLLAGDEEDGNVISDSATIGIPSMFGWDSQSRLSMGNLPGVSEFNGLKLQDVMLGPLGSFAANVAKGMKQLFGGDPEGLATMSPPFLKKAARWVLNDSKVRDYNNKPLMDPTAGEQLGIALGFQPTRLRKFNDAQRVAKAAKTQEDAARKQEVAKYGELVKEGKYAEVNQWMLEQKRKDPLFDIRKKAQTIANQAVELTFPRDLRRETGGEEYAQALRIMGYKPTAQMVPETQRKQAYAQHLMNMGVRPDPASFSRTMRKASTEDELRAQYPEASRYEIRRMAERLERNMPIQAGL
jgi:hypothetical protein